MSGLQPSAPPLSAPPVALATAEHKQEEQQQHVAVVCGRCTCPFRLPLPSAAAASAQLTRCPHGPCQEVLGLPGNLLDAPGSGSGSGERRTTVLQPWFHATNKHLSTVRQCCKCATLVGFPRDAVRFDCPHCSTSNQAKNVTVASGSA